MRHFSRKPTPRQGLTPAFHRIPPLKFPPEVSILKSPQTLLQLEPLCCQTTPAYGEGIARTHYETPSNCIAIRSVIYRFRLRQLTFRKNTCYTLCIKTFRETIFRRKHPFDLMCFYYVEIAHFTCHFKVICPSRGSIHASYIRKRYHHLLDLFFLSV